MSVFVRTGVVGPQLSSTVRRIPKRLLQVRRRMIVYPLLLLLHVTLIPAGIALIFVARRRPVIRHRCDGCGYDTRASTHLCPECGAVLSVQRRPPASSEQRLLRGLGIVFLVVPLLGDAAVVVIFIWAGLNMF